MARPVPITPEVLAWAIRNSGYRTDEIADRLHVPNQTLTDWISGTSQPKLTQLRHLASFLHRPLATFLLPAPPVTALPQTEFRHPPGEARRALNPVELTHLREASRLQRGLAWILSELGEEPATLPRISIERGYEEAAADERRRIGVSITEQCEWATDAQALETWRRALQEHRVIVFFIPLGSSSSRGFSLWNDLAPLIAANTHWNYRARMFTLFHEYAHLITRTNSACAGHISTRRRDGDDPIERWCEHFAAAFLAPWQHVENVLMQQWRWRTGEIVNDLNIARRLANLFHISLRAMTLRLIDHNVSTWDLYRQIPPQTDQKRGGGGGEGRRRPEIRLDEYGERTVKVLVEGMQNEVLSRTDVLGYLDVADQELDSLATQVRPR